MSVKRLQQRCLLLVCLTMALLASPLALQATAQEDEPTERRARTRDTASGGEGEAGVQLNDISALTGISSPGDGSGGGGGSGCSWTVVNEPEHPAGRHLDNVETAYRAVELRTGETGTANANGAAWQTTAWLNGQALALEAGGANLTTLRYVQPYGSEACNQALGAWVTITEVENLAQIAFEEGPSQPERF